MKAFYKGKTRTVKLKGKRIGFYFGLTPWERPQQTGDKLKITQVYNSNKTGDSLSLE